MCVEGTADVRCGKRVSRCWQRFILTSCASVSAALESHTLLTDSLQHLWFSYFQIIFKSYSELEMSNIDTGTNLVYKQFSLKNS